MKYKIKLFTILIISICLSVFGALVDNDPSNPSVITNVFELTIMTLLVFVILTTLYFVTTFTSKKIKQLTS
jgi:hypothetical protein